MHDCKHATFHQRAGSGQLSPITATHSHMHSHMHMRAGRRGEALPTPSLTSLRLADTAASMAFESPHGSGWAALGFSSSGMVGSDAVIASTKAANGGIGVFNLGGFSPAAITEIPAAVAGSGRRLSDARPSFTIFDVRLSSYTLVVTLAACTLVVGVAGVLGRRLRHQAHAHMRKHGLLSTA